MPEAEQLMPGVTASIKESSYNQWMKGLSAEQSQKIRAFYQRRYEHRRNERKGVGTNFSGA